MQRGEIEIETACELAGLISTRLRRTRVREEANTWQVEK